MVSRGTSQVVSRIAQWLAIMLSLLMIGSEIELISER